MKANTSPAHRDVNTYSLLVGSHDKQQSVVETMVYLLLIALAAFSMWSATQQRISLPLNAVLHASRR